MTALFRSHIFSMLLAALVFGAVIPCEVLETAGVPVCMEEESGRSDERDTGAEDVICCAVCLACCAVSLQSVASAHLSATTAMSAFVPDTQGLRSESHIPVWHPPRA